MQRVLQVPELLSIIFSSLGHKENVSNALVCKKWSNVALDVLWGHVNDVCRLVRLLAPITTYQHTRLYCFTRPPTQQDWQRFMKYSHRVRKLTYNNNISMVHHTLFDHITRTRPTSVLFPNLRHLDWGAPPSRIVLFLHPGLRHLTIHLMMDSEHTILLGNLARNVLALSKDLKTLEVRTQEQKRSRYATPDLGCGIPISDFEVDLCYLIRGLRGLQHIYLPRGWVTNRVAEAASRLPSLLTLDGASVKFGEGCFLDAIMFSPSLTHDSDSSQNPVQDEEITCFPSLSNLHLTTKFTNVITFLDSSRWNAKKLTALHIVSPIIESASTFGDIIRTTARNCPAITAFSLKPRTDILDPFIFNYPRIGGINDTTTEMLDLQSHQINRRITYYDLAPLMELEFLKDLQLHHHKPVSLSLHELEAFAQGIGRHGCIEVLDLFSRHPWFKADEENALQRDRRLEYGPRDDRPVLKIAHTMRTFAKWCPSLRSLSVFVRCCYFNRNPLLPPRVAAAGDNININHSPSTSTSTTSIRINPPFPNLRSFSFGYSHLYDQDVPYIVAFLSLYLSKDVKIDFGDQEDYSYGRYTQGLGCTELAESIRNWKLWMQTRIREIVKEAEVGQNSASDDSDDEEDRWPVLEGHMAHRRLSSTPVGLRSQQEPDTGFPDYEDLLKKCWNGRGISNRRPTLAGGSPETSPAEPEELKALLHLFNDSESGNTLGGVGVQPSFGFGPPYLQVSEYVNRYPSLKAFLQERIPAGETQLLVGKYARKDSWPSWEYVFQFGIPAIEMVMNELRG